VKQKTFQYSWIPKWDEKSAAYRFTTYYSTELSSVVADPEFWNKRGGIFWRRQDIGSKRRHRRRGVGPKERMSLSLYSESKTTPSQIIFVKVLWKKIMRFVQKFTWLGYLQSLLQAPLKGSACIIIARIRQRAAGTNHQLHHPSVSPWLYDVRVLLYYRRGVYIHRLCTYQ